MSFDLCLDTFGVPEDQLVNIGRKRGWGEVRKMARYRFGKTRLYHTYCIPCVADTPLPRRISVDAVNEDVWDLEITHPGAVFQVASNFHSLEQMAPDSSPESVPLSSYFFDQTQGPAAVLPTSLDLVNRRYLYRGGEYTDEKLMSGEWPLDMLCGVKRHGVAITPGGWADVSDARIPRAANGALALSREVGCVFVEDALVTHAKDGRFIGDRGIRVHQVLTSALDMNFRGSNRLWMNVFLFAAYINTLSVVRDLEASDVYLTLVGGGVFSNPVPCIFAAMATALNSVSFDGLRRPPRVHVVMKPMDPSDQRSAEAYRCLEWVRAFASNKKTFGQCLEGISSGAVI